MSIAVVCKVFGDRDELSLAGGTLVAVKGLRELASRVDAEFEIDVAEVVFDGFRAEKHGGR